MAIARRKPGITDPRVKLALARLRLEDEERRALAMKSAGKFGHRGWSHFNTYLKEVTPAWSWDWPHLVKMQETLERVVSGEFRKVMFFIPPRHGKTEQNTVRFAAYCLENDPEFRVMLWAYNQTLVEKFSRKVRRVAYGRIDLSGERKAAEEWETAAGGGIRAAGVGVGVTGMGANLIIIDDPVKSREEAESEAYRERVWDSYRDDLFTRLEPGGAIVLTMCMTGDTPVLMATGEEKLLRDIRPGDRVATYEDGNVSVTTVRNWINNGPDRVYEIRMESGIIVKANTRHPFLTEEGGVMKWQRTAMLRKGSVILKVTGGNGRALPVPREGVTSRLNVKECANPTTTSSGGNLGFGHLRSILGPGVRRVYDSAMGLASRSMNAFWLNKVAFAPSVGNPRRTRTPAHIGTESSALTIATTAKRSGGFSATIATLLSVMEKPKKFFSLPLSTYEITRDTVAEVVEVGIEDVFDVEIERTENFIANGLVSHNTRWHEDDLAARILDSEDGPNWHVVCMPAFAESQSDRDEWAQKHKQTTGQPDPIGREPGEPLCPDRFSTDDLNSIRIVQGSYGFSALYQQRPTPAGGGMFPTTFPIVDTLPPGCQRIRYWDKAGTEGGGCYTAGVLMARSPDNRYFVVDVVRGQWSAGNREKVIKETAHLDGTAVGIWLEQEPGSGGKESAETSIQNLAGYWAQKENVTGDKESRARPLAAQAEIGNVYLIRAPWNRPFIDEAKSFPSGKYKDQVDAAGGAFNKLALAPSHAAATVASPRPAIQPMPNVAPQRPAGGIPGAVGRW